MARVRYVCDRAHSRKGRRPDPASSNRLRDDRVKPTDYTDNQTRHDSGQEENVCPEQVQSQQDLDQIHAQLHAAAPDGTQQTQETGPRLFTTRQTRPAKQPRSYEEFATTCKDILRAWDRRLETTLRHVAVWYEEGKATQAGARGSWQRPDERLLDATSKAERCMWEIGRDLHVDVEWVERRFAHCKKLCVRCERAHASMISREAYTEAAYAGETTGRITEQSNVHGAVNEGSDLVIVLVRDRSCENSEAIATCV